jgi:hypothetical protein
LIGISGVINISNEKWIPDVDKEGTYAEIVKDWAEPTVMLREAISNSLDANATHISIEVIYHEKEEKLDLVIADNGCGMNSLEESPFYFKGFFDLGKSKKKHVNYTQIGAKGHGSKTLLKSSKVDMKTWSTVHNKEYISSSMDSPWGHLKQIPPKIPPVNSNVGTYENLDELNSNLHGLDVIAKSGTLIEVYDAECPDISWFEYDRLKLFLHYRTGACRFNHLWEEVTPVTINLKVSGIPKPKKSVTKRTWLSPAGTGGKWVNQFSWKGGFEGDIILDGDDSCRYFPPMICTYIDDDGDEREFNLLLARLEGKYRQEAMLVPLEEDMKVVGGANEWLGFYLAKDGFPVYKVKQGDFGFMKFGDIPKWLVVANCQFFDLTANRDDMRKTSEFIKIKDCIGAIAKNIGLHDDFDFEETLKPHGITISLVTEEFDDSTVDDKKAVLETKSTEFSLEKKIDEIIKKKDEKTQPNKNKSKSNINKPRQRKTTKISTKKLGGTKNLEDERERKKISTERKKQLSDIKSFMNKDRAKLTKPDGKKIAIPSKPIDCALMMAAASTLPEMAEWNVLTVDAEGKRPMGVISKSIESKKDESYSSLFVTNLSDLIGQKYQEILTDYVVCWKLGDLGNITSDGDFAQVRVKITASTSGYVQVVNQNGWILKQRVDSKEIEVNVIVLSDLLSDYID